MGQNCATCFMALRILTRIPTTQLQSTLSLEGVKDFRAMVIEKVIPNDVAWLLEREEMWIRRLETKRPHGLNRID